VEERTICNICAWREFCKKKYSISSKGILKCPDFTRDLILDEGKNKKDSKEGDKEF
jgi:hypothetical protein